MSLTSLKNILRAEKCYYTGIKLQVPTRGVDRIDDMSIDRIDASLPYQKGNVVACCRWANGLKNVIESQQSKNNILSFKAAEKVMKKTIKRMEEQGNV